jgi:tetratricopeptide (TPR) repeat protein
MEDLALAGEHQAASREGTRPHYSNRGVWAAIILARAGRVKEAIALTRWNAEVCRCPVNGWLRDTALCDVLLADLTRKEDPANATQSLEQAMVWGISTGDQETLVWANLVKSRLARDQNEYNQAAQTVEEGLRIARACGYGLYHIDLVVEQGRLALSQRDATAAERYAHLALHGDPERHPALLGALHPECRYFWGRLDGLTLQAESLEALGRKEEAERVRTEVAELTDSAVGRKTSLPPYDGDVLSGDVAINYGVADYWGLEGVKFGKSGNHQKALECFTKAVNMDPYDAHWIHMIGVAHQKLNENAESATIAKRHLEKACKYYREAERLDPRYRNPLG